MRRRSGAICRLMISRHLLRFAPPAQRMHRSCAPECNRVGAESWPASRSRRTRCPIGANRPPVWVRTQVVALPPIQGESQRHSELIVVSRRLHCILTGFDAIRNTARAIHRPVVLPREEPAQLHLSGYTPNTRFKRKSQSGITILFCVRKPKGRQP